MLERDGVKRKCEYRSVSETDTRRKQKPTITQTGGRQASRLSRTGLVVVFTLHHCQPVQTPKKAV